MSEIELSPLQLHKSKMESQKTQLANLLKKQTRLNSEISRLKKTIKQNSRKVLKETEEFQKKNFALVTESQDTPNSPELAFIESQAEEAFNYLRDYTLEVETLSIEYLEEILSGLNFD